MDHTDEGIAVEKLTELGLSVYAAQTFLTLVSLGKGTAREVSQASTVPRTKVYDAVEELRHAGLVDVQEASPQQFHPVSVQTAARHFTRTYRRRVATMTEVLEEIEPAIDPMEDVGVWTVRGSQAIEDRSVEFIRSAEETVVYMTVGEFLTEAVRDALKDTSERDVEINIAGISGEVEDRIRDEVPGVCVFESLWDGADAPAGRLLMVDEETILVSVVTSEHGGRLDTDNEVAIWGTGEANSLVVVLKAMFTWRMQRSDY